MLVAGRTQLRRRHGAPLLSSGHPGSAIMKVCVAVAVAAIETGCSIEMRDSDIVVGATGTGCSTALDVVSSEGMHTRSPISRICAELYGTATMRPLLMHTPPCLP